MPFYILKNKNTGDEWEELMTWDELQQILNDYPELEQMPGRMNISSGFGMKPPDSFRDLLRNMKKNHSKGFTRSTINTF